MAPRRGFLTSFGGVGRRAVGARLATLLFAVAGFNTALTFQNVWPTLWVRPTMELSVELLVIVLALALLVAWRGGLGRGPAWGIAAVLCVLVVGRYADVTAHALFGRPINLYFDVQHLPHVVAMTAGARSASEVALFTVLLITAPIAVLLCARFGVAAMAESFADIRLRRAAGVVACVGIVAFGVGRTADQPWINRQFALPVSPVYANQASFILDAAFGATTAQRFAAAPVVSSDLGRLEGGDAYVVFFESYGAFAYREPAIAAMVRSRVGRLQQALAQDRWRAVSGYVTAPTFGGASWLSHSSLLSGVTVSRNRDYQLLLSSQRETMVDGFRRAGYRTVALLPGLKRAWPEGAFYGFDKIYDGAALAYGGPAFGWWAIPDQFSLERFYRREVAVPGRRPLFVIFATIMSHLPFKPLPPYLADWSASTRDDAYRAPAAAQTDGAMGEWTMLRRSYRAAIRYNFDMLDGFLRRRAPEQAVVIVLGDHQPPAVVSGSTESWEVPVHVLSRRKDIVARFRAAGLRDGLLPSGASLGDLATLYRIILEALDSGEGKDKTYAIQSDRLETVP